MIVYKTDHFKVELERTARPDTYLIIVKAPYLQFAHTMNIHVNDGESADDKAFRCAQDIAKKLYMEAKSIYENIHPDA